MENTFNKQLYAEWHPTKNIKTLDSFTYGSRLKAWWVCSDGHEWEARINHRFNGSSCPYCSGRFAIEGVNDLLTVNPFLAAQWHPTKNGLLTSSQVTSGSSKKVWWLGECGHEWEAVVKLRSNRNQGCPYCLNKKIISGENSFAAKSPLLLKEWDFSKNKVSPETVSPRSTISVFWLCSLGHSWETTVYNRVKGYGCGVCAYKPVKVTKTEDEKKELLRKFWHPTKNAELTPEMFTLNSNKIAYFKCEKGHEWEKRIQYFTAHSFCPTCNTLAVSAPDISASWHPTKNGELTPNDLSKRSGIMVWWQCEKGHEWQASPDDRNRIDDPRGCPKCSSNVSKSEMKIAEYIKSLGFDVKTNDKKILKGLELDIYVPAKQVAVEFNGLYWHSEDKGKDRTYHYNKWLACKEAGIQLIQIWEDDWNRNPEQVKRMLAHKLGITAEPTVYARNTFVYPLSKFDAEKFFNVNHIQGFSPGSYYFGLVDKRDASNLVAVLNVKKEAGTGGRTLNIIRYATSCNVPGGFTKLLKHVEGMFTPERIITFSDNTVSDGGLYEKNGFFADKQLDPDYMYLVKGERKHKFGYRLKRFRNDPELQYVEGLTERELAKLNDLPRIWDAGKTRWVKTVQLPS